MTVPISAFLLPHQSCMWRLLPVAVVPDGRLTRRAPAPFGLSLPVATMGR